MKNETIKTLARIAARFGGSVEKTPHKAVVKFDNSTQTFFFGAHAIARNFVLTAIAELPNITGFEITLNEAETMRCKLHPPAPLVDHARRTVPPVRFDNLHTATRKNFDAAGCSDCGDPISWHYKTGCSNDDCFCPRTFGSRIEAPVTV